MAADVKSTLKDMPPNAVMQSQNRQTLNQMPKGLTSSPKSAYKPALAVKFFIFRTHGMANHKSAKKRIIRNGNRALINGARISRIRTFVKKVEVAIASGDATAAREALRAAQPELQRGVSRGVLHKNTVSRKISRLASRVKALAV